MADSTIVLTKEIRHYMTRRREALGLSQRALAAKMRTTQSAVSDLESGRNRNPVVSTVGRWAEALGLRATLKIYDPWMEDNCG